MILLVERIQTYRFSTNKKETDLKGFMIVVGTLHMATITIIQTCYTFLYKSM